MAASKLCNRCTILQELQNFHKHSDSPDGFRNICKSCTKQIRADYYRKNKEREQENIKKYLNKPENKEKVKVWNKCWKQNNPTKVLQHTLTKYGLTVEQFQTILAQQDYCCAICNKLPKQNKRLSVDHNHLTGKVRGLLCDVCNTSLGKLEEDTTILSNMINYINKHKVI